VSYGERAAARQNEDRTYKLFPETLPSECADPKDQDANNSGNDADEKTKKHTKDCVYALKAIIDDHYREYRITLHHFADGGDAVFDITTLGLNTAGAVTPAAAAKTVLAAMAAAVGSTKTILNQDLLYKQTIEILINQMDADRDRQFTVMLKEMDDDKSTYSMGQAKDDLLLYFAAGTWDHAIAALQASTAANQANCKRQLNKAKVKKSTKSASTDCAQPSSPSDTDSGTDEIKLSDLKKGDTLDATAGGSYKVISVPKEESGNVVAEYISQDGAKGTKTPIPFSVFAQMVKKPSDEKKSDK